MDRPLPPQPTELQETCLGLPRAGERVLTDDERAQLQAEATRAKRQGCTGGCAIPFSLFCGIACITLFYDFSRNSPAQLAITLAGVLLMLGVPALIVLLTNDAQRKGKCARADLQDGRIALYHGQPPGFVDEMEIDGVSVAPDSPVTLEVLSASRRLWRVNGKRATRQLHFPAEHTAPQPSQAVLAAKWAQTAVVMEEGVLDASNAGRRELSSGERDEINVRARALWRRPALLAGGLMSFIGLSLGGALWTGATIRIEPGAWLLFALTLYSLWALWQTARAALLLLRDAREGNVIVVRLPTEMEITAEVVVEVLPHSGWTWTANGQPASWRALG